jgi:Dyp-type peroxidase family
MPKQVSRFESPALPRQATNLLACRNGKSASPFESPALPPFEQRHADEESDRPDEPQLEADQIQGNIFPGFSKDFQTLLFLRITEHKPFAAWLGELVPRIATLGWVLGFSRLYKAIRFSQTGETGTVKSTWINIAFSFAGLKKLAAPGLGDFVDEAFTAGLLARSQAGLLGDPVGRGGPGDPKNWVVGGPGREADVVLLLAGDDRDDLDREVARIVQTLFPRTDPSGKVITSGAEVLFRQDGATLTGPLRGHEHFGFKDGISQPGVRGILPDGSFLTLSQNPLDRNQGKPGQDLLWPGEFVFGYPGQDAKKDVAERGIDPLKNPKRKAPEFAKNGSFLVFRRLRQEVGTFHRFLQSVGQRFELSPALVGAKMVGRWASGAPAVVTPEKDDTALAEDDCRNNNFEYDADEGDGGAEKTAKAPPPSEPGDCENVTDPPKDPQGLKVPFAGHIRKAYPRNDHSADIPGLGESSTQTHRLMRRGIPFGRQSASTPLQPMDDDEDRGLLFLAYQVSIVDQFEFVTRNWVNNADFKSKGAGFDPIIGQNDKDPSRVRTFRLNIPGETQPIEASQDWVIPTGGGYFFAPSIHALGQLAGLAEPMPARRKPAPARRTRRRR